MSACSQDIRLYDDGTEFIVEFVECDSSGLAPVMVPIDISGASVRKIIFEKPDGAVLKVDAAFVTDGTDGKIKYSSVGDPEAQTGDLDQEGKWRIQGRVELPGGTWTSTIGTFRVKALLDD